ncbi:MAG: EpsG family protein [Xanthomonadaceae bacterium]|nr:EpsG family protein [Xanthomonadaceae bacterium]
MFLFPAWAVLMPGRLKSGQAWVPWVFVFVVFTLMMGLRHEVGGDWGNYLPYLERAGRLDFDEAIRQPEAGYFLLNWVGAKWGGIHFVNLVCAVVLMWGTVRFCRQQPWPWLALAVAVPYMLIVVGMGYTRQAVALGFALLGLVQLGRGKTYQFVLLIALGAMFHKSAVLLVPIAALASSRHRLLTILMVGALTALLYYLLLADNSEVMWENYIVSRYQSQGGLIRVLMNIVPAVLMLVFAKRIAPDGRERRLWIWMSILAIICFPLVLIVSTAVDRVALYLIPLQLFVFSRLPRLARTSKTRTFLVAGTLFYYASVQFVWLNFGVHSQGWLPYQFMPLW